MSRSRAERDERRAAEEADRFEAEARAHESWRIDVSCCGVGSPSEAEMCWLYSVEPDANAAIQILKAVQMMRRFPVASEE